MTRSMDEKLLAKYRDYASSEEALAVLFVKRHLPESRGHWVDPVDFCRYQQSADSLHFRFVVGGLYQRKRLPKYPPKSDFTFNGRFDEHGYLAITRALTWEAAHTDIQEQQAAGVVAVEFEVRGVSYDRNRGSTGFFRDDAPEEIKALASNLQDRTNPLWDHALKYANAPEFVFEIRRATVLGAGRGRRAR
ncbi:hypothetical protein [Stenotrophomonas maltophilia]|uniref:hypothetical protein n=1 Tax=Stenotrophomonas maltophilia TaxID=40324 RepID=UPI0039F6530A